MDVNLCSVLIQVFFELRPAFSRLRTAQWAALVVLGFCIRRDTAGVTSFVRAFSLRPNCYQSLLDCFSSSTVKLEILNQLWLKVCLKIFNPVTYLDLTSIKYRGDAHKTRSWEKVAVVRLNWLKDDESSAKQINIRSVI
jgi:hypothetical protein